ncbi:MAG: nucleoside hydrolase [Deltaproteobacteria bacterium]
MRVWIDTDIGSDVDDALTLGYVLRHPKLELVGLSTVFGDVELRADIARRLIATAGASDIPILTGLGAPLTEGRDGLMFGNEGQGIVPDATPRMVTPTDEAPEQRIDELASALERTKPDALIAIGPLSNLGALAARGVALPPLAIMGGKTEDVLHEGMVAQIPEWNWYCDPVAVKEVLTAKHAELPRLVPAEVTFQTALLPADLDRLAEGSALPQKLAELAGIWLDFLREKMGRGEPRVALHDPLTAAILVDAGLSSFTEKRIRTDARAASFAEAGPANISVATDVDNDALRHELMETLLRE